MISEKIVDLTSKLYHYIGPMRHKDRDCHWYIETAYSYGDPPTYTACIKGYIFSDQKPIRLNFEQAERDLLDIVRNAIKTEWVNVFDRKVRGEDFDEDYPRFVGIFNKEDYES